MIITPKQSVIPTDTAINKQEVTQVPQHRMPRSNTKLLHVSITKIDCLHFFIYPKQLQTGFEFQKSLYLLFNN